MAKSKRIPKMDVRAGLRKTKRYALHSPSGYSKIARRFMKASGQWFLEGMPGHKWTLEELKARAEILKARKHLDFKETPVEG